MKTRGKSIFYKNKNILDKSFKKRFYKKYPEYEGKDTNKAMRDFFETCLNLLTEKPNGIFLDKIGYFANAVFDKKLVVQNKIFDKKPHFNLITQGNIYRSYFFPDVVRGNKTFSSWSFRVCKKGKQKMANSILNGLKYKCHYNYFIKNENYGRKHFLRSIYK